jgi:hypothetical protein
MALKEPIADCETILFPLRPKEGMRCFRVDRGKLYVYSEREWKQVPVPLGKYWLDPHELVMKRMGAKGWRRLDRLPLREVS